MTHPASQSHTVETPKTMPERLLRVRSLICMSRLAYLHLSNEVQSEYWDLSEALIVAEEMIGECAEEIEVGLNKKEGK